MWRLKTECERHLSGANNSVPLDTFVFHTLSQLVQWSINMTFTPGHGKKPTIVVVVLMVSLPFQWYISNVWSPDYFHFLNMNFMLSLGPGVATRVSTVINSPTSSCGVKLLLWRLVTGSNYSRLPPALTITLLKVMAFCSFFFLSLPFL